MNYAIVYLAGILLAAAVWWYISGKKNYTGPLIEAQITEDDAKMFGGDSPPLEKDSHQLYEKDARDV